MAEEIKVGDNGELKKDEVKFDNVIKIGFDSLTGEFGIETNVKNLITGYGMLEFAKKGVEGHIVKQHQSKIVKPQGGIMDFARRFRK